MYPVVNEYHKFPELNLFSFDVYVQPNKSFKVNLPNIVPELLSLKTREDCLRLTSKPLAFYQNQFNMAVWFATTGCGISVNDQLLNNEHPMIKSLYHFHVCYQISKILNTLEIPIPGESAFKEYNNNMNVRKYRNLLSKFGLKDEYDFSVFNGWDKFNPSDYNPSITDPGYYIDNSKINFFLMQVHENNIPPMFQSDFDKGMASFKYPDTFIRDHVNRHKNIIASVNQKPCLTYQSFMILNSKKLTPMGIEMINDSIRTYVYCILGAQAETRAPIIGQYGTDLGAQIEFRKLLSDSIKEQKDIPTSIERYQKALSETHKRLDYVVGKGLYIIPSDMVLKVGAIENYNNNLLIATTNDLGKDNLVAIINNRIQDSTPLMEGTKVKRTILKTNSQTQTQTTSWGNFLKVAGMEDWKKHHPSAPPVKDTQPTSQSETESQSADTHESIKFYLFMATGALVSLALYFSQ